MMLFPVTLAFAFGSQLLLSGLALASIPLLIHLLHRRHFVETRWAAMRFLLQASQKQSRRTRIEQLLLLLLRTILIAAFVLALARPVVDSAAGEHAASTTTHRILVLDASYSMQFREGEVGQNDADARRDGSETRFEKAKQQALALVRQAQAGDLWNIVRVANDGQEVTPTPPSQAVDFITQELQELKVSDAGGDFAFVVPQLLQLAGQAPNVQRKEIVVFTDSQSAFWSSMKTSASSSQRTAIEELQRISHLSVINVASGSSSNVAVTELQFERAFGLLDRPNRMTSVLRNSGSSSLKGQIVDLLIDDRLVETKRVDLPADIAVPIDWLVQITSPGEHLIEVHVEDDQLPIDNRRRAVLPVRDEVRVLLVDGDQRQDSESLGTTAFYVGRALAPQIERTDGRSLIRPTHIWANELSTTNLDPFDVIVIVGGWQLTDREIQSIESAVRKGRGLIVFPSDGEGLEHLNASLFRDGNGPLPGRLLGLDSFKTDAGAARFDVGGAEHQLIREFQRNPGSGLEATLVFRWAKIAPHPDSRVALKLTTHAPMIVERSFGRGKTLLLATTPLHEWSTWGALAQSFVPLLHEAIFSAVSSLTLPSYVVGQPVTVELPHPQIQRELMVRGPDRERRPVQLVGSTGYEQCFVGNLNRVAVFRLIATTNEDLISRICVNADPDEGVLATANTVPETADALRENLALAPNDYVANEGRQISPMNPANRSAIRFALLVTLLILLGEPLFSSTALRGSLATLSVIVLIVVGIETNTTWSAFSVAALITIASLFRQNQLATKAGREPLGCRPKSTPLSSNV